MAHTLDLWRWRVTDAVSGRRYVTRYGMTEANALDFDPAAERIEGTLEQRVVHDDPRPIRHARADATGGHSARAP